MIQDTSLPLVVDSAIKTALDPRLSAGEAVGGFIGCSFGPVGYFVGGTLGRLLVIGNCKLTQGGCGQNLGLLGSGPCIHTKSAFGQ
jgi:hypothetical protein